MDVAIGPKITDVRSITRKPVSGGADLPECASFVAAVFGPSAFVMTWILDRRDAQFASLMKLCNIIMKLYFA